MYTIYTIFDKSKPAKPKPIASVVHDSDINESYVLPLFVKGNTEKAIEVKNKLNYLKAIITAQPVILNDFKSHIIALKLETNVEYKAQEVSIDDQLYPRDSSLEPYLLDNLSKIKSISSDEHVWRKLMAKATLVYHDLEKRGVIYEGNVTPVHPSYQFITTGRASTSGFNIQGMPDGTAITHVRPDYNLFICADWLSADLRAAAVMSNDKKMLQSFDESDPYTTLASVAGISRDECKNKTLPNLYSMNLNSDIFKYYDTFKEWAKSSISNMDKRGYSTSLLGRKFLISGTTDQQLLDSRRQVFNAQMQGTVAHAMHNVLIEVHKKYPFSILTELHDSLILCCNRDMIKPLIEDVSNIMLRPFKGIIDNDPIFPLRMYIGNKWRPSKLYKVYRTCNG